MVSEAGRALHYSTRHKIFYRLYTTNAIESLNRDLRKVVKIRASFPTETAAMKLLYLAVRKIEKRWLRPSTFWKAAMRELAIEFGDRITPYID